MVDGPRVGERLAATKFSVPDAPAGDFPRPRLLDQLESGVQGPLTLVVAPPGSGKTVLVSSWARETRWPVAWLALDATDADPRRFWAGVLRALREAGVTGLPTLDPDFRDLADELFVDLVDALTDREHPVVLVLDDLHEIGRSVVPQLDRLLEHPPPALRLVVISRRDPALRLGRLRVSGRVTEIRARDLACTRPEAGALLANIAVGLPEPSVTRLWERTEGWMAGLVLAAISLRASDDAASLVEQFDGEDATLSDYLMSEVLARQPNGVQDFLLETSIVDVLEGDLADALTSGVGGHTRLVALARDGVLLAPIDRRGRWFRHHALFRDLLRAQLRWRRPEAVEGLHRRAAAWYLANGDDTRAVRHAIDARDWDLAARVAVERWIDLHLLGELTVLAPLLDAVPADRVAEDAPLAVALAAVSSEVEAPERASPRIGAARTAVADAPTSSATTTAGLALVELLHARHTGERAQARDAALHLLRKPGADGASLRPELRSLVLTYLGTAESWTGHVIDAREHLREALSAADRAGSAWLRMQALSYLAGAESTCGDVVAARRRADQALELARVHGWTRTPAAGAAAVVAALIATLQCRFADAVALVETVDRVAFSASDRPMRAASALPKLVVLAADGRVDDALDVVRAALAEIERWPLDVTVVGALRAWEARLLLASGDRAAAEQVLDDAEAGGPEALLVLSTRARLMVDDGDHAGAHALIASRLEIDGPMFRSIVLDLWLVDALARDGLGDTAGAGDCLERALALAAPGELLRPIVSHGDAILPLLRRQARGGTHHRALVDRAIDLIERQGAVVPVNAAPLEPLSERERQVLGYLPSVMSNKEIADELFVSVNTVKTHARSIYRKLGVSDRRAAVTRARELGLFSSR